MKLYATIRVLERLSSRALFLAAIIFMLALNYKSVSYAADNEEWVSFDWTYRYRNYYSAGASVYRYGILPYNTLYEAMGQVPGDQLTMKINSVNVTSITYSNSAYSWFNRTLSDYTSWSYCNVNYTDASGGTSMVSIYPDKSVVFDYGGGDFTFNFEPRIGYIGFDTSSPPYLGLTVEYAITVNVSVLKPPKPPLTDNEALNELVDQNENFRNEDRSNAEQAGSDASSFVNEMQSLESKWEILWLPIKFTSQVISVFSGGTSSANYVRAYGNVQGYTYDESSGFLVPVYGSPIQTYADIDVPGGASITFPAYTLPVLDLQIWDAYTFDLTTIKNDFPLLFNALYVVISILEVYWFIAFCRDKYQEVFGDE